MDERIDRLERQFKLLKYPVVCGGDVLPPAGVIADFLDRLNDEDSIVRARRNFLPIPVLLNREGYAPGADAQYWRSGLTDYDKIRAACRRIGIRGGRYYDFAGSTGRVFRHFYGQDRDSEVWSSGFNTASFRWNQQYMPTEVRVFLSGIAPPLLIPDAHFDVVTALSVFPHIDELEAPWLLEMRRILNPGGLLYATFHDEAYWKLKPEFVLEAIRRSAKRSLVSRPTRRLRATEQRSTGRMTATTTAGFSTRRTTSCASGVGSSMLSTSGRKVTAAPSVSSC